MRDIFSEARWVIAWLGMPSGNSGEVFEQITRGPKDWLPTHLLGDILRLNTLTINDTVFARRYWTRLWILQEVILARDVIYMCGSKACRQEEFCAFVEFTSVLNQSPAGHILRFRNRNEKRFGLRELLEIGWQQQCEDPRDKVFGLLGLARHPRQGIEPVVADYGKPVLEVFEDVVRALC